MSVKLLKIFKSLICLDLIFQYFVSKNVCGANQHRLFLNNFSAFLSYQLLLLLQMSFVFKWRYFDSEHLLFFQSVHYYELLGKTN